MPDNHIPEGTVIGALSFVPMRFKFEEWAVYAGCPVKKVGERNKDKVLEPLKNIIDI
jgi:carbonic anhydrase/acetyltransferase-like protein (isoleucine patch superfamily)